MVDKTLILRKLSELDEYYRQMKFEGKCLIVNDSKKLASFKMTAYSRIVNFQYYRGQFQAGIIRKVMEGI